MKLSAISVVLSFSGITLASMTPVVDIEGSIAEAAVQSIGAQQSASFGRLLEVSEQCRTETDTIHQDPGIVQSFGEMLTCVVDNIDVTNTTQSIAITVDFDQCSGDYATACSNVTGTLQQAEVKLSCSVTLPLLQQTFSISLTGNDYPGCIGQSCTSNEVSDAINENLVEFANRTEQLIEEIPVFGGRATAECEAKLEHSSATVGRMSSIAAGLVVAVASSLFL